MSRLQIAIGVAAMLVEIGLLAGLVRRGHHRREPFFALYIAGVVVTNGALGLWYRWDVWLIHQAVTAALRFGVALGLGVAVFRHFPAAGLAARRVALFVLFVTLAGLFASRPEVSYTHIVSVVVPRIANGAVWLFTGLAALVLWYRLPLTELQKAILLGFAPYLLVFTVAMNALGSVGWQLRNVVGYVDNLSYLALMGYWCRVAWRANALEPAVAPAGPRPAALPVERAS